MLDLSQPQSAPVVMPRNCPAGDQWPRFGFGSHSGTECEALHLPNGSTAVAIGIRTSLSNLRRASIKLFRLFGGEMFGRTLDSVAAASRRHKGMHGTLTRGDKIEGKRDCYNSSSAHPLLSVLEGGCCRELCLCRVFAKRLARLGSIAS